MENKMKNYCPHAFNALEITTNGVFKPCCITSKTFTDADGNKCNAASHRISEVYASDSRREWIENFDDTFATDCNQCYQIEKSGGESKRLREIKFWEGYYRGKSKVPIMSSDSALEVLDLKLGNTCNLACATCHSSSSSKWNSIYKQHTGEFNWPKQNWQDTDEFWEDLITQVQSIKKIEIAGGEPFMNKKQRKLINYLVDNDLAKDIDICWITNSTFYNEDIISKFKHFKLVRVMISLDNTHEQFEFMRYPAIWSDSYKIFSKFNKLAKEGEIELGISHSISALNVYHLPEMWEFGREHRVPVYNNIVMAPFCMQDLPAEFKQTVKEKLECVTDPSYQTNPAVGPDNWIVEFMMREKGNEKTSLSLLEFVRNTRPGLFEKAFPELIFQIPD